MKSRAKTDIRRRLKRASDNSTNDIINKFNDVIGLSASSSDKKTVNMNNKNESFLGQRTINYEEDNDEEGDSSNQIRSTNVFTQVTVTGEIEDFEDNKIDEDKQDTGIIIID